METATGENHAVLVEGEVAAGGRVTRDAKACWGHANRLASLLTKAQARLLEGHFRVEQEGR